MYAQLLTRFVHRRTQSVHTPLQLREQVLLVAAIVGLEDQGTGGVGLRSLVRENR